MTGGSINTNMGARDWLMLVVLSVLWGGSFFFVGVAVREWPPLTVVVVRVAGAALVLWPLLRIMGLRMPRDTVVWTAFFGMGLLNNAIPFCLNFWGQTHISSGVASILNATTPLFTVIIAHFVTNDERMKLRHIAGVLFGLAGVVVMTGEAALQLLGGIGLWLFLGQIAIVMAAISYSFAGVYGRRFRRLGVAPIATATGQVTASTILMVPIAAIVDKPWTLPIPSAGAFAAMAGLAILSTAFAYILYFRVLASSGATNIMLVTFLVPVSAILLGVLILGEQIATHHIAGMALIGMGLGAIDGRFLR